MHAKTHVEFEIVCSDKLAFLLEWSGKTTRTEPNADGYAQRAKRRELQRAEYRKTSADSRAQRSEQEKPERTAPSDEQIAGAQALVGS